MSHRTYVLDTNVLLFDPRSLFVFEEHEVVIPLVVIEEIDRFKKNLDETGHNARQVSRFLDDIRGETTLKEGVLLDTGGTLRIAFCDTHSNIFGTPSVDNSILHLVAHLARQAEEDHEVVLVTRDTNMRIKCDAIGITAENYQHDRVNRNIDEQFSGLSTLEVGSDLVDELHREGVVPVEDVEIDADMDLFPNENVVLKADRQSALGRVSPEGETVNLLSKNHNDPVWGITPRNKEQAFAMAMLLDPRLQLVTLAGKAGTGKTLLAIACGMTQVADEEAFRKMLVARPIIPMGRDMGYLPGTLSEKMDPWMKPIYDNLELLIQSKDRNGEPNYQYLFDAGMIAVEPLTYIRGRSIPNQFMIIDEAQNLTSHEVKTILTRAGEGTKIVLTGDPAQIDNPYVDGQSNGLTYVIERFKGSHLAGHVTLTRGERSELADAAAKLL